MAYSSLEPAPEKSFAVGQRFEGDGLELGPTVATIPVVERTLTGQGMDAHAVTSTNGAVRLAQTLGHSEPGLLFTDAQNRVTAWVPLSDEVGGRLRTDGRFSRLITSATEAGANAAVISNPSGAFRPTTLDNLASALKLADVRVLDVVDPVSGSSAAANGTEPNSSRPVFSTAPATVLPSDDSTRQATVTEQVRKITSLWSNAPETIVLRDKRDAAMPADVREYAERMAKIGGEPEGFFHDGKVYLLSNMLHTSTDVTRVLMHETLGHFGLRATYGAALGTILDRISVLNAGKVRRMASALGLDFDKQSDRRIASEEVLAEMAQSEPAARMGAPHGRGDPHLAARQHPRLPDDAALGRRNRPQLSAAGAQLRAERPRRRRGDGGNAPVHADVVRERAP
jgi:hypothetical protein